VSAALFDPRRRLEGAARPVGALIAVGSIALMVMPFFSTFGELLTNAAMTAGFDAWLGQWVAPTEIHLVRGVLALVGLRSAAEGQILFVGDGARGIALFVSWNCVGWQTLIFLGVSMLSGLYGGYTRRSRVEVAFLGIAGIVMLNILRIAVVAIVAFHFGQLPAVIVHDYGSVIGTVAFLMGFWAFAYNVVLERVDEAEA
jgi:exosortase/archaeosortase family protein